MVIKSLCTKKKKNVIQSHSIKLSNFLNNEVITSNLLEILSIIHSKEKQITKGQNISQGMFFYR